MLPCSHLLHAQPGEDQPRIPLHRGLQIAHRQTLMIAMRHKDASRAVEVAFDAAGAHIQIRHVGAVVDGLAVEAVDIGVQVDGRVSARTVAELDARVDRADRIVDDAHGRVRRRGRKPDRDLGLRVLGHHVGRHAAVDQADVHRRVAVLGARRQAARRLRQLAQPVEGREHGDEHGVGAAAEPGVAGMRGFALGAEREDEEALVAGGEAALGGFAEDDGCVWGGEAREVGVQRRGGEVCHAVASVFFADDEEEGHWEGWQGGPRRGWGVVIFGLV